MLREFREHDPGTELLSLIILLSRYAHVHMYNVCVDDSSPADIAAVVAGVVTVVVMISITSLTVSVVLLVVWNKGRCVVQVYTIYSV